MQISKYFPSLPTCCRFVAPTTEIVTAWSLATSVRADMKAREALRKQELQINTDIEKVQTGSLEEGEKTTKITILEQSLQSCVASMPSKRTMAIKSVAAGVLALDGASRLWKGAKVR